MLARKRSLPVHFSVYYGYLGPLESEMGDDGNGNWHKQCNLTDLQTPASRWARSGPPWGAFRADRRPPRDGFERHPPVHPAEFESVFRRHIGTPDGRKSFVFGPSSRYRAGAKTSFPLEDCPMQVSPCRPVAVVALLALLGSAATADEKKPAIVLPKDPKAVVLSYDPGAGGFIRKGEAPYLKIQANGQITVTDLHTGAKTEGKLTAKELEDLLAFVVVENDLYNVTAAKMNDAIKTASANGPFIAIGGAGTSVITVEVNEKKHEVSFRAAGTYLNTYPKVQVVPQFVAVEKKLSALGLSVVKGKDKEKDK